MKSLSAQHPHRRNTMRLSLVLMPAERVPQAKLMICAL